MFNSYLVRGWYYAKLSIGYLFLVLMMISCSAKKDYDKITLRLKWIHQGQFAGFYVAKNKGFYDAQNIDLEIRAGGQNLNAIKLVAAGSDTFGVWGADQLIIAKAKNIPIKVIAVIYPISPVCFTSLKDSKIKTPKDFIGKRIGVQYGTNVETEYVSMLKKLNIDRTLMDEIPVQFNFQQLLEGKVDVWPSYVINEPILAYEKGFEVNVISPSEYGVKMYADTLFASEDILKNNPDLVYRFLKATIKGWVYSLEHPKEAAEAVLAYDGKLDMDHELRMIKAATPLVKPSNEYKIGWMKKDIWSEMKRELLEQKLLEKDIEIDSVFTMQFLNKIYKIKQY
jgi:ABC-type nitrate/sulfonate/bicarbonate transport system substrate-binding protein